VVNARALTVDMSQQPEIKASQRCFPGLLASQSHLQSQTSSLSLVRETQDHLTLALIYCHQNCIVYLPIYVDDIIICRSCTQRAGRYSVVPHIYGTCEKE